MTPAAFGLQELPSPPGNIPPAMNQLAVRYVLCLPFTLDLEITLHSTLLQSAATNNSRVC